MIKANTFLDEADLQTLLNAPISCGKKQKFVVNTLIELLWTSGARISEVVNLRITDFDSRENFLTLRKTKNKRDRIIPITETIAKALVALVGQRKNGFIFQGRQGSPMGRKSAYNALQRRVVASGLGKSISLHTFRHRFITDAIDRGVALPKVQRFVGHSSLAVTGQYYDFAKKDLRDVLA